MTKQIISVASFLSKPVQQQSNILASLIQEPDQVSLQKLFQELALAYNHLQTVDFPIKSQLILASASPRRKQMLEIFFALEFTVVSSTIKEYFPEKTANIALITKSLALLKLSSVLCQRGLEGNVILSADTLVALPDGTILGKPSGASLDQKINNARRMLLNLLGKEQIISSAIACFSFKDKRLWIEEESAIVRFKPESASTRLSIENYLELAIKGIPGRGPLDKAGSYGIQEPEIANLIDKIEGDLAVVIGLPITSLRKILIEAEIYKTI